ncbi:MAG: hypothetical protein ACPLRZ_11415 [Thermovenabulum sp.]|uniref:recombination directionality factor n=1 Tax=Thermovenabulum sp. TaxID=3100335 RepID=UPI003C7C4F67
MPIKGWSDVTRLQRIGQIAIGKKDERGIPTPTDYFVVPDEVKKVYGEKPRELDIIIPSEDIETIFPAYLKRYGEQYGLICRGDGEYASLSLAYAKINPQEYRLKRVGDDFFDEYGEKLSKEIGRDGKEWLQIRCTYKNCPLYKAKKCKEIAVLNVILPKVSSLLGVYSIDTGSFNSYINIRNALELLRRMIGRISFVPLKLKVKMVETHPTVTIKGEEKKIKKLVPVMYIDMDMNYETLLSYLRQQKELQELSLHRYMLDGGVEIEPVNDEQKPELLYPETEEIQNEENEYENFNKQFAEFIYQEIQKDEEDIEQINKNSDTTKEKSEDTTDSKNDDNPETQRNKIKIEILSKPIASMIKAGPVAKGEALIVKGNGVINEGMRTIIYTIPKDTEQMEKLLKFTEGDELEVEVLKTNPELDKIFIRV